VSTDDELDGDEDREVRGEGEDGSVGLDEVWSVSSTLRPTQAHCETVSSELDAEAYGETVSEEVGAGDSPELDVPVPVSSSLRPTQDRVSEEAPTGGDGGD
jgi:hypothetical protein